MRLTIDTDARLLYATGNGSACSYALFSPEAFRILSHQWLLLGWNLGHWKTFSWMGRQILQFPDDILRLAELIWTLGPDVIVETGVYDGGSTLMFASLCQLRGKGRVISIDREFRPGVREAVRERAGDRVTFIQGDSGSPEVAEEVRRMLHPAERVCVFLDSEHTAKHVTAELHHLSPLVTPGSYLIVADTICVELAQCPEGDSDWAWDNPGIAAQEFLATHPEFVRDRPPALFSASADFTELSYFAQSWLRRL